MRRGRHRLRHGRPRARETWTPVPSNTRLLWRSPACTHVPPSSAGLTLPSPLAPRPSAQPSPSGPVGRTTHGTSLSSPRSPVPARHSSKGGVPKGGEAQGGPWRGFQATPNPLPPASSPWEPAVANGWGPSEAPACPGTGARRVRDSKPPGPGTSEDRTRPSLPGAWRTTSDPVAPSRVRIQALQPAAEEGETLQAVPALRREGV